MSKLWRSFLCAVTRSADVEEQNDNYVLCDDLYERRVEEFLKQHFDDVIDASNTVLYIVARKTHAQAQNWLSRSAVKSLPEDSLSQGHMADLDALNAENVRSIAALDTYSKTKAGKVDMDKEEILQRGAKRGRDMPDQTRDKTSSEVHIELGKQWRRPSRSPATRSEFSVIRYQGILYMATLLAAITFHAALRPPTCLSVIGIPTLSDHSSNACQAENQVAAINHPFFLVNSVAFYASLAVIITLLYKLPIKPWLLIIVSSAVGAYMCAIVINSPEDVVTVLLLGSSILLAAFLKCLALHTTVIHHLQWMRNGTHLLWN